MEQSSWLEHQLQTEHRELKKKSLASAAEQQRMRAIEAALERLATAEGTYRQPMLADQVSYLYYMLGDADQVPGQDAEARLDELRRELQSVQSLVD